MLCNFTREEYLSFIDKLYNFCDEIRIVNMDDENYFIKEIFQIKKKHDWTRKFPGYGKKDNLNILYFDINEEIIKKLKLYSGFFEIGYDSESEEGIDLAFYNRGELVFHVLNHEKICFLEDKFVHLLK